MFISSDFTKSKALSAAAIVMLFINSIAFALSCPDLDRQSSLSKSVDTTEEQDADSSETIGRGSDSNTKIPKTMQDYRKEWEKLIGDSKVAPNVVKSDAELRDADLLEKPLWKVFPFFFSQKVIESGKAIYSGVIDVNPHEEKENYAQKITEAKSLGELMKAFIYLVWLRKGASSQGPVYDANQYFGGDTTSHYSNFHQFYSIYFFEKILSGTSKFLFNYLYGEPASIYESRPWSSTRSQREITLARSPYRVRGNLEHIQIPLFGDNPIDYLPRQNFRGPLVIKNPEEWVRAVGALLLKNPGLAQNLSESLNLYYNQIKNRLPLKDRIYVLTAIGLAGNRNYSRKRVEVLRIAQFKVAKFWAMRDRPVEDTASSVDIALGQVEEAIAWSKDIISEFRALKKNLKNNPE